VAQYPRDIDGNLLRHRHKVPVSAKLPEPDPGRDELVLELNVSVDEFRYDQYVDMDTASGGQDIGEGTGIDDDPRVIGPVGA